jgi:peptidoglycan/xylan/chitin deacetylase (PgdA/CDA1 family)
MNWFERKILGLFVKTNGMFSRYFFSGKGIIFMLHRVLPEEERNQFILNKDLAISPEKLEEFILHFKSKGYIFITLDDVQAWLEKKMKIKQKFICLTFDDGYRDNLIYGLPILEKHAVPATIYITNCFPNGTCILWWYFLEKHIETAKHLNLNSSIGKLHFSWENREQAHAQFHSIGEAIKSIPIAELPNVLMEAFGKTTIEFENLCQALSLSWDEIVEMSKHPLISIGAHTMNHVSLKQQSGVDVENEMRLSKKELEHYIGKEVSHFAYPYGGTFDVSSRELELAHSLGFKTSTLNQAGNIFKSNHKSMQGLARMPLGNNTNDKRINYYLNGIYHFSNNQFNYTINIQNK